MPRLVHFYIRHVLIGWAIAAAFVAVLIGFDVAGLRHLVFNVSGGWIAAALLFLANASVFGGVQFAIAVMGMAEDDGPKGGLRLRLPAWPALRHIPAEAPRRR